MGEDNERILGEILHYPPERIEQLTKQGVLFKQPREEYLRRHRESN
jgi:hypothetical protein